MKVENVKRTFMDVRTLSEERTERFEAKVELPGLGIKWIGVYAQDWRSAQKALQKLYGSKSVKSKPVKI